MRYFGGGIGHLNNTLPQQADPLDPISDEMDMEADEEDDAGDDTRDGPQDAIMNDSVRGLYIGIVIRLYTPSPPSIVLVL